MDNIIQRHKFYSKNYYAKKIRFFFLGIILILVILGSIWVVAVLSFQISTVLGILLCLVLGLPMSAVCLVFLYMNLCNFYDFRPDLVIDAKGITVKSFRREVIPWDDINYIMLSQHDIISIVLYQQMAEKDNQLKSDETIAKRRLSTPGILSDALKVSGVHIDTNKERLGISAMELQDLMLANLHKYRKSVAKYFKI